MGYLEKVNESGWYTSFGPLHQELSSRLEDYLGVENLLLVSNATLGLQVAYKALGINKAICTPFTFAATASSLSWEKKLYKFVDIDQNSLNLSVPLVEENLQKSGDIDGIVATHVYGNPCDLDGFKNLSSKYNIKIVYDGAHAFGVKYNNNSLCKYGDASILSFNATKVFNTLEGGAIVFKNRSDFRNARKLINFSIDGGPPTGTGTNAKLDEYRSAVGLTMLERIEEILEKRQVLFSHYLQLLESYFDLPIWNKKTSFKNGAYFPIILEDHKERVKIAAALMQAGIPSREYFSPSLNLVYKKEDKCPVSESVASRILCLPLHYYLTTDDVEFIANKLIRQFSR